MAPPATNERKNPWRQVELYYAGQQHAENSYDQLGRRIKTDGSKEDTVYTYDEVSNLVTQPITGAYDLEMLTNNCILDMQP